MEGSDARQNRANWAYSCNEGERVLVNRFKDAFIVLIGHNDDDFDETTKLSTLNCNLLTSSNVRYSDPGWASNVD